MKWDSLQLDVISDGSLRLDGGSMFGVIPKILWSRRVKADEQNRIRLATNCLLIRSRSKSILVDTGCGSKYSEKQLGIYAIDHHENLVEELLKVGVGVEDVDWVINTHLHFDHCGGNTRTVNGKVVPTFPRAQYLVRRAEYEAASHPNERDSASYFPENWKPVEERGQLRLIEKDEEVIEGVTLVHTPGHTSGHQSVKIESGGRVLFYIADLCPTAAHVPLPWIMAFDLFPLTTLEVRKRIYRQAVEGRWLLMFEHDPETICGYLEERAGRFSARPAVWPGRGAQPPEETNH